MRRLGMVLASAAVAGAFAPAADAAVTTSATCTPTTLDFPGFTNIACTLTVQTGAQEERFSASAGSPAFAEGFPGAGAALAARSRITLTGPGAVSGGSEIIGDPGQCSTMTPGLHGYFGSGGGTVYATIPANTTTTFSAEFQSGGAPWPTTSLAPIFTLGTEMPPGQTSTLAAPIQVKTPEPQRTGPSGVRIDLQTKPATPVFGRVGTPTVKSGKRVKVFGTTNPPLDRQRIQLLYRIHDRPVIGKQLGTQIIAKVRTNRAGRFVYKRFVPASGLIEIAARYRSQRPGLADDYTCSRSLQVRE